MKNTNLYLIRHGATDVHGNGDTSGANDLPLNDVGVAQIQRLTTCLNITSKDIIYSSTLLRAKQTAEIIASRFGSKIIEIPEIRKIDMGDWDGMPLPNIRKRYPEAYEKWISTLRNNESLEMLCRRVDNVLYSLLDNTQNKNDIFCVTHGGPIRAALISSLDIPLYNYWKIKILHGSVSCFEYFTGQLLPCYIGQFVV